MNPSQIQIPVHVTVLSGAPEILPPVRRCLARFDVPCECGKKASSNCPNDESCG